MNNYKVKLKIESNQIITYEQLHAALVHLGKVKVDHLKLTAALSTITLAEFTPDEVLQYVDVKKHEFKVGDKLYPVRMNSHRYFLFKASRRCVACGIEGTKMLLQKHANDNLAHFNLYAVERDALVLMTKDHINAKSQGGEDRHTNYQTMCCVCNNLKGSDQLSVEDIAELRKYYNENITTATKKKFNSMMVEAKKRVLNRKANIARRPLQTVGHFAKQDINIICDGNRLIGVGVYGNVNAVCIGCIPKGTKFYSLVKEEKNYRIPLSEGTNESFLVPLSMIENREF
jgi:hypothetical protein